MVRRNLSHAVERQWVIFEFQKPSLTKAKAKAKCKFYVHDNETHFPISKASKLLSFWDWGLGLMGVRLSLSFQSNHFSLRGTTCSLGQRNIHFVTKWACQSLTSRIRPGGLFLEYFCSFFFYSFAPRMVCLELTLCIVLNIKCRAKRAVIIIIIIISYYHRHHHHHHHYHHHHS